MYLIDSDVIINFLKGEHQAVKTITKIQKQQMYVSIITVGEIFEGLLETNKNKLTIFNEMLKTLTIINIDRPIIEIFAKTRRFLRKTGLLIDNFDLLIASTALAHDLTLITNNFSHFKRIPKIKIYS